MYIYLMCIFQCAVMNKKKQKQKKIWFTEILFLTNQLKATAFV